MRLCSQPKIVLFLCRSGGNSAEVRIAKMCLIDLAGSERATVTKNQGMRMREGANINRSLLALGNCINSLASESDSKAFNDYFPARLLFEAIHRFSLIARFLLVLGAV